MYLLFNFFYFFKRFYNHTFIFNFMHLRKTFFNTSSIHLLPSFFTILHILALFPIILLAHHYLRDTNLKNATMPILHLLLNNHRRFFWSGRRDSNPRHQPWQGCTLPLSYTRTYVYPPHHLFNVLPVSIQNTLTFRTAIYLDTLY